MKQVRIEEWLKYSTQDKMVFVGELFTCLKNKNWRYNQAAHLFCDKPENIEELHKLAQRIGLKRSWFQSNSVIHHYDLIASKQKKAIKAGAVFCDRKTECTYIRKWRALNKDGCKEKTT